MRIVGTVRAEPPAPEGAQGANRRFAVRAIYFRPPDEFISVLRRNFSVFAPHTEFGRKPLKAQPQPRRDSARIARKLQKVAVDFRVKTGAARGIRTPDPIITN